AEMRRLASHVHDVAHLGSFSHLERDVADLDRVFHHIEGLVAEIEHDADHNHFGHGGHFHGNTRHVRRLLNNMGETLHHLQDDLRDLRPRTYVPVRRPAVQVAPYHGGGI